MDKKIIKVIAMDLDGTLTQHKQLLDKEHRNALDKLSERYKLLMVGAGQVGRIFKQLGEYPIDIIGNYGLQYGIYDKDTKNMKMIRDISFEADKDAIDKKVTDLRKKYGYTEFAGENTEFHIKHENVVYIGDDYGLGGNDESVYKLDFNYLTIDNYMDFPEIIKSRCWIKYYVVLIRNIKIGISTKEINRKSGI